MRRDPIRFRLTGNQATQLDMDDDGFRHFEPGRIYETHNPFIFFWAEEGCVELLNRKLRPRSRVWQG